MNVVIIIVVVVVVVVVVDIVGAGLRFSPVHGPDYMGGGRRRCEFNVFFRLTDETVRLPLLAYGSEGDGAHSSEVAYFARQFVPSDMFCYP